VQSDSINPRCFSRAKIIAPDFERFDIGQQPEELHVRGGVTASATLCDSPDILFDAQGILTYSHNCRDCDALPFQLHAPCLVSAEFGTHVMGMAKPKLEQSLVSLNLFGYS